MNGSAEVREDELLDIEECLRPVVREWGRDMFALVMAAGMAGQAAEVLGAFVGKHRSSHSAHALGVLSSAFNQVSTALAKEKGWGEGELVQCQRDVERAWAGKIAEAPKIVLEH